MARYAVGDVQGCDSELKQLLNLLSFDPGNDELYLVGDLVNRGPGSLAVLRLAYQMRASVKVVLGNHDLHLLACWAGISKPKMFDTFNDVLAANDCDELMHWLRQQPLMRSGDDFIITHAGINPAWNEEKAQQIANRCSEYLAGDDYLSWLGKMYGNTPLEWRCDLSPVDEFRIGINSFTRMRMVTASSLDFKYKGALESAPLHLNAWFNLQNKCTKQIIFGHWSALGIVVTKDFAALDSGCIWGGQLTAYSMDDGRLFQVPALRSYQDVGD